MHNIHRLGISSCQKPTIKYHYYDLELNYHVCSLRVGARSSVSSNNELLFYRLVTLFLIGLLEIGWFAGSSELVTRRGFFVIILGWFTSFKMLSDTAEEGRGDTHYGVVNIDLPALFSGNDS